VARFAFITVGVPSHVNQCSEVARRLLGRGHEVVFFTHDPVAVKQLQAGGLECIRLNGARQGPRRPVLPHRLSQARAEVRKASEAVYEDEETLGLIEKHRPDVVLIDYELKDHVIRIVPTGQKVILIEYHCSVNRTGRVPILSSHLVPSGSCLDRLRFAASWWVTELGRRGAFFLARLCYGRYEYMTTLKRLAKRHGFDFRRDTSLRGWHYLSFPNQPTLYFSAPEFDFPNDFPNRDWFVGPRVEVGRHDALADDDAARVRRWLGEGQAGDERPLILCALGTQLSKPAFCKAVLAAAAKRSDWRVLLTLGRRLDRDSLGPIPDNALVANYAPQLEVLGHADLMLTHGGASSIAECIIEGVPMVVYSGEYMDQNGNAARVAYHRLGLRRDIRKATAASIEQAIEAALGDEGLRGAVARMRWHGCGGTDAVARMREILSAHLESPRLLELLEAAAGLGGTLPEWREAAQR
jgi:UDP:flavonoid glycosyltransferase YjiC (YdhE family)